MNERANMTLRVRVAALALLITGLVNTMVYTDMISRGYPLQPGHPEAFRDLQRAMTFSDAAMTLAVLAGAAGLWLNRSWGRLFGVAGATALVYMGILDVAFLGQHGMYGRLDSVVRMMIVVDAWAIGVGTWIVFTLGITLAEPQRRS